MRVFLCLALVACGPSVDELIDDVGVDAMVFGDPPPDGAEAHELDVAAEPYLAFTAWGLLGMEQTGTWSRYNVRVVSRGEPDSYAIRFVADLDSTVTGVTALDEHIRTADFLHVEDHPTAEFVSTAVEAEGSQWRVRGDMTLRGTTKPIDFLASIDDRGDVIATQATITLSRWDFGLYAEGIDEPGADGARDDVVVDYDVQLALLTAE